MSNDTQRRLPISTRHAFALAFELAFRRDPLQSLAIPLVLRAPWLLALAILPPVDAGAESGPVVLLASAALIGDFITSLIVGAMLRVRARSVYNAPRGTRPAAALECYAEGMRRVPGLLITELVRNFVLALAASPLILPAALSHVPQIENLSIAPSRHLALVGLAIVLALPSLFVVYRLGVATEAVVLGERDVAGAFQSSFRLMRGHVERWFELTLVSGLLALIPTLLLAGLSLAVPADDRTRAIVPWLTVVAVWPVIQYAWTFFYLRLVEVDGAAPVKVPSTGPEDIASSTAGA
jgi:hypothetical protein